ncbi:hypothetical protein GOP47_0006959 [Adiantum capillus-veneris]|uniref:Uncharacterized protein n=1 Tax=Adiantum capillus-veneris TaxID=13818 RepID=A0A9D4V0E9_ADICA|nr:hypothetical protein GOP47_0006959 [Adiantum capillus-veneris]
MAIDPICSDQVSSVAITEDFDDNDNIGDESESTDIGLGSMNEVDAQIARQEAALELVPFHIAPEVASSADFEDDSHLHMDRGEDILKTTRVFSCFECPLVPLCRLIPYARVRGLRSDVSGLKAAFAREGYIKEKGAFIVSLQTCQKEQTLLTGNHYYFGVIL